MVDPNQLDALLRVNRAGTSARPIELAMTGSAFNFLEADGQAKKYLLGKLLSLSGLNDQKN